MTLDCLLVLLHLLKCFKVALVFYFLVCLISIHVRFDNVLFSLIVVLLSVSSSAPARGLMIRGEDEPQLKIGTQKQIDESVINLKV